MSNVFNPTREQLEADANLLRDRLAKNLEALEYRSHEGAVLELIAEPQVVQSHAAPDVPVIHDEPPPPPREQLEADANFLRDRLARNLESLDARRHEAFDVKAQLKRHPLPIVLAGTGALFAIAGGSAFAAYRIDAYRYAHRYGPLQDRWGQLTAQVAALSRAIRHPERLEPRRPDSVGKEIMRGVVVSLGTFIATQLAKRALHKFVPDLWQEPSSAPAR